MDESRGGSRIVYPKLLATLTEADLASQFRLVPEESTWAETAGRRGPSMVVLATQLKVFQIIGHFLPLAQVPATALSYIAKQLSLTVPTDVLEGVEIRREIADIPEMLTDRYKLLQIVVNLIGNACDAMATNDSGARFLAIRVQLVHGQVEITVEDYGIGIPAEMLPRIWEFGFTTKAHGHGFGLHSSAVAAQQLGGTIATISAGPGLGACFTVNIPASVASQSEREAAA